MARIKNTAEVKIYANTGAPAGVIKVESHHLSQDRVSLEINGKVYAVYGSDLKLAIDNCMNVGR